jgi:hypothetical protein
MPEQKIGTCSICGGEVIGWVGPFWSTVPPPPPRCASCGAVSAAHDPVIPMRPIHPKDRGRLKWGRADRSMGGGRHNA